MLIFFGYNENIVIITLTLNSDLLYTLNKLIFAYISLKITRTKVVAII